MDMEATKLKRPATAEIEEASGSAKRGPINGDVPEVVYRLLCPSPKTGGLIGKGGSVIKQLRDETGARIRIIDVAPGTDERVVLISSQDVEQADWSPAQEALFRIHALIIEGDHSDIREPADVGVTTTRLLVPSSQVGCLLGKGGSIIAQMREETGASIRVLSREHLPPCASPGDEVVQIIGELDVARKALHNISARLRANPPRTPPSTSGTSKASPRPISAPFSGPPRTTPFAPTLPPFPGGEIVYRILFPEEKVGSLIGKSGATIQALREATGAKIKVGESNTYSERVITVTGVEEKGAQYSPAQEALFRVFHVLSSVQSPAGELSVRLLVPATQIGCILGKGGSIISQMRAESRAAIRILPKEHVPDFANEGDELVQVSGDPTQTRLALLHISTRLRANLPKDALVPPPGTGALQATSLLGSGGPVAATPPGSASPRSSVLKMTLPPDVVGAVIGRGGSNISQIRQISGARVVLKEAQPGTRHRVLEISGTPEETRAAKQLLDAFVLPQVEAETAF